MPHDPRFFLEHILESIQLLDGYTAGLTKEAFFRSIDKQDMILRRLEIIGEAVKNLPPAPRPRPCAGGFCRH